MQCTVEYNLNLHPHMVSPLTYRFNTRLHDLLTAIKAVAHLHFSTLDIF